MRIFVRKKDVRCIGTIQVEKKSLNKASRFLYVGRRWQSYDRLRGIHRSPCMGLIHVRKYLEWNVWLCRLKFISDMTVYHKICLSNGSKHILYDKKKNPTLKKKTPKNKQTKNMYMYLYRCMNCVYTSILGICLTIYIIILSC